MTTTKENEFLLALSKEKGGFIWGRRLSINPPNDIYSYGTHALKFSRKNASDPVSMSL